jgi:hypothetical protein
MHGCHSDYRPPNVKDYGDLRRVTGAVHLLLGAAPAAQDLSFSSPDGSVSSGVGGVSAGSGPTSGTAAANGAGTSGGGAGGGTGAGGGGGGGKGLPFTGLEVGVVAAVGSALTATGAALRRATRRRRP